VPTTGNTVCGQEEPTHVAATDFNWNEEFHLKELFVPISIVVFFVKDSSFALTLYSVFCSPEVTTLRKERAAKAANFESTKGRYF